jgi:hypothetical protein
MADDKIPQAQAPVLEANGKFTIAWYRFFSALNGILTTISDNAGLALLKASNLSDVASAATAFTNIKQAASGTTTGVVQQTQADFISVFVPKVVDGDIVLVQKAGYAMTITSSTTDASSGTCSVRLKIDGSNVGSTANSVSTTETEQTHSTGNSVAVGQTVVATVSSNSSCLNMALQVNFTRNLAA